MVSLNSKENGTDKNLNFVNLGTTLLNGAGGGRVLSAQLNQQEDQLLVCPAQ